MKKILVTLLLISISFAYGKNISGFVVDKNTGETIIGVNVIIEGTGNGAATNTEGFFIIRNVLPGNHKLVFSHISYLKKVENIEFQANNILMENISLEPTSIETEAIEVTGKRSTIIEKDLDISSFEVDPVILLEVPQMNKDVFQLMKFSPSVSISDPLSPQFHVRGSDPGENLVQLDGMTIYNPQHFMAGQAIFNPYAIKNIEMLVGGFDAEYGGRNASILNITSREGHNSEVHGEFRPSISGMSGAIEFPVNKNSTAMFSGRYYSDITFRVLMNTPNIMSDFVGSYKTKIGNTRLRLSGFYARDYMNYDITGFTLYIPIDIFDDFEEGFLTNTENRAIGIQTNTVLLPNLLFNTQLYYSGSDVDNKTFVNIAVSDTVSNLDVVIDYETKIENRISDYTAKANFTYFTFLNQTLKLGVELNNLDFRNRIGRSFVSTQTTQRGADLQAIFFQDKVEWGNFLMKIGMRNSRFMQDKKWQFEPRVSAAYKVGVSTLKLAWGHYNQYITTMNSKNNEFMQTLDYFNSLKDYDPISSEQYIAGIEAYITDDIFCSMTGYFKDLNTLYKFDYSDASRSGENTTLEKGSGEAWGLETLIRGKYRKLSGWISYTLSRGTRSFPSYQNGRTYLYDADQTHNLKTVLLYNLTKDITASTTFQFSSGYPKTWETGKYSQFSYDIVEDQVGVFPRDMTPKKNNVRFPSRLLLDIGWKKKLRSGFGSFLAEYLGADEAYYTMTIRNILFLHRNPYYYFHIPDFGYYGFGTSYLPSVSAGYSIKF